eukprot:5117560-Pleurochrysis_carterae.AAC.1
MIAFISLRSTASISSGAKLERLDSSGASGAGGDGVLETGCVVLVAAGAEPAWDCDRVVGAEAAVAGAMLAMLNDGIRGEGSL